MRDILDLWNGEPSEDKCKRCGSPYYPVMICPNCEYKTTVTNVCRICVTNMQVTGKESHFCTPLGRIITRRIKGYVNKGTIYEVQKR